jgi:hypothetical protein
LLNCHSRKLLGIDSQYHTLPQKNVTKKYLLNLKGITASKSRLAEITATNAIDLVALLFQAGYLTIKGYEKERYEDVFALDLPNIEVKKAFSSSLLADVAYVKKRELTTV